MSDFYTGLQATASRLLVQFGKPMTLRINTGSLYDPVAQTNAPTYTDYPVSGLVLNYGKESSGISNESGTFVQTADKKLLISVANAPEPTTGALVVDGADVYTIQNVKSLSPAGINLLFELQGRK
jgi:hypothetical protein